MREFDEAQRRISEEIQRLWKEPFETFLSFSHEIAKAVTPEAQTRLIELTDPTILTPMHKIVTRGTVFLISALELIKVLKTKYITPGAVNVFPKIVDDFLKGGKSSDLSKLSQYDLNPAIAELRLLPRIVSQTRKEGVLFLSNVDPIRPLDEYVIDGRHTSGLPLRSIETPAIVLAEKAHFPFTSALGVKISDGRMEKNMIGEFFEVTMIVNEVENNIITSQRGKAASSLGDFLAILAIFLSGLGIAFLFARRGRFWEIGIPMALSGMTLFYLRYFSQWGREYFEPGEIEIYGEAPMELQFFGDLGQRLFLPQKN